MLIISGAKKAVFPKTVIFVWLRLVRETRQPLYKQILLQYYVRLNKLMLTVAVESTEIKRKNQISSIAQS